MKMNKIIKSKYGSYMKNSFKLGFSSNKLNLNRNYTVGQDLKTLQGVSLTEALSSQSVDPSQHFAGKKVKQQSKREFFYVEIFFNRWFWWVLLVHLQEHATIKFQLSLKDVKKKKKKNLI